VTIRLVSLADGEVVNIGPIRTRILEDGGDTGHRLGVVEVSLQPGTAGPPQHIHREHDETFFVVSGTVHFTSGEEHIDVSPGSLLTVPIGVPHTFANPDPGESAVMLCTVSPDRYISYFRDLAAAAKETGRLEPAAILEIMSRYATEPYQRPGA
jgi:mannose-6-phosphate isomerase-like protein (cupin superfamily)